MLFNLKQFANKSFILVTWKVLKLEIFKSSNLLQSLNIPSIFVTRVVIKLLKSKLVILMHPENI